MKLTKRLEREREEKVEFGNGHILMSSSTSIIHNLLIKRISRNLDKYLNPKGCDSLLNYRDYIRYEMKKFS